MKEIFIKNTMDVEVDGLKGVNRYIINAIYNVIHKEDDWEYYKLKHKIIEDLTLTWDEIEEMGGIAEVNKEFKECYNL